MSKYRTITYENWWDTSNSCNRLLLLLLFWRFTLISIKNMAKSGYFLYFWNETLIFLTKNCYWMLIKCASSSKITKGNDWYSFGVNFKWFWGCVTLRKLYMTLYPLPLALPIIEHCYNSFLTLNQDNKVV